MLAHPLLAVFTVLSISALLPSVNALPAAQDLSALCPTSDEGKFKCYSPTQFVICQGARTVVQSMAAGVPCVDSTGNHLSALPVSSPPAAVSSTAAARSSTIPSATPTSSPAPNTVHPIRSPSKQSPAPAQSSPAYDPLRRGTRTSKSVTCSKAVHVLGISLNNLFRCMDATHYVICKAVGPSDIYVVDPGWKCIQSVNGDGGVVVAA